MCRLRRGKRSLRHCPSKITSNTFNSVLTQSIKQAPPDKQVVDNRPNLNSSPVNAAASSTILNGNVGRENKDRSPARQADGKRLERADSRQSVRQDGERRSIDRGEERPIDKELQAATREPKRTDKQREAIKSGSISIHLDQASSNDRSDPANSQLNSKLQNGQTPPVDGRLELDQA